jgi:hypothetical protein
MTTAAKLGHDVGDAARDMTQNKYLELLGRVGLAAYDLVHFTIADLVARVALGASGAKADKGGALLVLPSVRCWWERSAWLSSRSRGCWSTSGCVRSSPRIPTCRPRVPPRARRLSGWGSPVTLR